MRTADGRVYLAQCCSRLHTLSTKHPALLSKFFFGLHALAMIATGGLSRALAQAASSGSIVGISIDERRSPLPGVEIRSGSRVVLSGADGRFVLDSLEAGRRRFVARRVGYAPESVSVNFDPDRADTLEFVMHPAVTELDRLDVIDAALISPRLQGFESRRARKNGGQFVTRETIERQMPQVTSDLLRRLLGVRIVDSMGVQLPVSTRGPKPTLTGGRPTAPCVLRVAVDGQLKEPYFPMNTITVADIHGIELYSGPANIPPEFGGSRRDAGCGLVMIWTRAR
jgi:hypothetical protein